MCIRDSYSGEHVKHESYLTLEWNGSFKQTLHRLDEAFGSAGRDCIARSEELLRVMGG